MALSGQVRTHDQRVGTQSRVRIDVLGSATTDRYDVGHVNVVLQE